MKRLNESVLALGVWKDTRGQDLVEYALAAGLVAVAAVACMPGLSGTVNNVFTKIGSIVNSSVQ
jgi:pilus assembly protein Flp/PilA